jgi:hypothetical protein
MNVVSIAFRDPVLLAKQCATIDVLPPAACCPPSASAARIRRNGRRSASTSAPAAAHRRGAGNHPPPLRREERVELRRRLPQAQGRLDPAAPRPARPADVDRRLQRGRHRPHRARRQRLDRRRRSPRRGRPRRQRHPRRRPRRRPRRSRTTTTAPASPSISAAPTEPQVAAALEAFRRRTGRDPAEQFAVGDADSILAAITAYVAAGLSKFIFRPLVMDPDQVQSRPNASSATSSPRRRAVAAAEEVSRQSSPLSPKADLPCHLPLMVSTMTTPVRPAAAQRHRQPIRRSGGAEKSASPPARPAPSRPRPRPSAPACAAGSVVMITADPPQSARP